MILYVEIAKNKLGLDGTREIDGVFDDNESLVTSKDDVSFPCLDACRSVELVGQQSLFLGPVQEKLLFRVERYQFVFCTDNQSFRLMTR